MSNHTEHTHAQAHDHGGAGLYLRTLLALLFLTIVTVGASYIDFGQGNVVIALAIATVKAILVAMFFMHLRFEKPVNAVIAVAGFLFLGIFLMFTVLDFGTRQDWKPVNYTPLNLGSPSGATGAPAAAPEGEKK
jgi:cytochrome c oxidase subunit IV